MYAYFSVGKLSSQAVHVRELRDCHSKSPCRAFLLSETSRYVHHAFSLNRQCSRLELRKIYKWERCELYILLGEGVLTPREIGDGMHRPARDTTGRKHIKKTALTNGRSCTVNISIK